VIGIQPTIALVNVGVPRVVNRPRGDHHAFEMSAGVGSTLIHVCPESPVRYSP
jgi:hypothetical protein